jgi:hypothetical protein
MAGNDFETEKKISFSISMVAYVVWHVTPSCWKELEKNIFQHFHGCICCVACNSKMELERVVRHFVLS